RIKSREPTARKLEAARHFVEASVSHTAIQLSAIRQDGSVIERCALRKKMGWDCDDEAPAVVQGTSGAKPPASSAAEAPRTARCACRTVGGKSGGAFGGVAAVVSAWAALGLRRRRREERAERPRV